MLGLTLHYALFSQYMHRCHRIINLINEKAAKSSDDGIPNASSSAFPRISSSV